MEYENRDEWVTADVACQPHVECNENPLKACPCRVGQAQTSFSLDQACPTFWLCNGIVIYKCLGPCS